MIGIGGHLAMPPLPHHRAYGSVPGGSTGLSGTGIWPGRDIAAGWRAMESLARLCFRSLSQRSGGFGLSSRGIR